MSEYKRNYEEAMKKMKEEKLEHDRTALEKRNLRNYSQFSLSGEEQINQYYDHSRAADQ